MTRTFSLLLSALLLPRLASAQPFAQPPGTPLEPEERPTYDPTQPPEPPASFPEPSAVRVSVGPVLRVAKVATDGGLTAAVDIGSGPAGVRLAGAWVHVGGDAGLAAYQGELFIDFGAERRLHPIVGAGAGVARLAMRETDGTTRLRREIDRNDRYLLLRQTASLQPDGIFSSASPASKSMDATPVIGSWMTHW
jgi:hypothetical protein